MTNAETLCQVYMYLVPVPFRVLLVPSECYHFPKRLLFSHFSLSVSKVEVQSATTMMLSKQFALLALLPQVFVVSGFLSSSGKSHEVVKSAKDAAMMLQGTRYPTLYSLDERQRTRNRVDTSYLTNLQKRLDSTLQKVVRMKRCQVQE
jgi:hypothetical protein